MADTEGAFGPPVTLDSTVLKGVELLPGWSESASEKHNIRVEVLQSGYTPSAGSRAVLHPKTDLIRNA